MIRSFKTFIIKLKNGKYLSKYISKYDTVIHTHDVNKALEIDVYHRARKLSDKIKNSYVIRLRKHKLSDMSKFKFTDLPNIRYAISCSNDVHKPSFVNVGYSNRFKYFFKFNDKDKFIHKALMYVRSKKSMPIVIYTSEILYKSNLGKKYKDFKAEETILDLIYFIDKRSNIINIIKMLSKYKCIPAIILSNSSIYKEIKDNLCDPDILRILASKWIPNLIKQYCPKGYIVGIKDDRYVGYWKDSLNVKKFTYVRDSIEEYV